MSYTEHYSDYGWIKVKRFQRREELSWEDNFSRLESHHERETKFLIEEVRRLSGLLDQANARIAQLGGRPGDDQSCP
jgi:hypothetical protein